MAFLHVNTIRKKNSNNKLTRAGWGQNAVAGGAVRILNLETASGNTRFAVVNTPSYTYFTGVTGVYNRPIYWRYNNVRLKVSVYSVYYIIIHNIDFCVCLLPCTLYSM